LNSLLLFEHDLLNSHSDSHYRLQDERAAHVIQHLKAQTGDELSITLEGKGLAKARAIRIENGQVDLEVCSKIQTVHPSPVHVMIGLSRPPTLKKIIEHGTTMGVGKFHFFKAALSDKSYLQSKVLKPELYEKLLNLGLSQSRAYAHRPKVVIDPAFPQLQYQQGFYLDQESKISLCDAEIDFQKEVLFAFGPERGWTLGEKEKLKNNGLQGLNLAPTTLRVEHALFALLGQYHLLKKISDL
jgi:RsmE family RNA methyltransferase